MSYRICCSCFGDAVRLGGELAQPRGDLPALGPEPLAVDQYTAALHAVEHRHERLLDFLVEGLEPRRLLDLRPERPVQPQRHVRIRGRVLGRALDRHLIEGEPLRAATGHVLELERRHAEIARRGGVHVVARRDAVQHVGLEHRVVAHAGEPDAVVREEVRVVFEMVAELRPVGRLEDRLQRGEHALAIELRRRAGIVVMQRNVRRRAGLDAERDADDLGAHVVEAGRLGVEREEFRLAQPFEPALEMPPFVDRLVPVLHREGGVRFGNGGRGALRRAARTCRVERTREAAPARRPRSRARWGGGACDTARAGRAAPFRRARDALELPQQRAELVARVELP